MRSSDYLFRLIKALSKGDRRNFKLFAQLQDGDKQYIKLFDAIDKQADYDEERLLKQFEGEKFTNQFSVAKNYLYNYILKTLHIFRKDAKTELNALMHQVQILMSKNLFEQAQKLLRKAKHLAERQERFLDKLSILETERALWVMRLQAKEYEAFIDQVQQDEQKTMDQIANLMNYGHLYDRMYRVMKRGLTTRDNEQESLIRSILVDPIISDPNKALSVRAAMKRLDVMTGAYRVLNDGEALMLGYQKLVETFEANEYIRQEKTLAYINAVSNLGMMYHRMGFQAQSMAELDKLKTIPVETQEEELAVLERYFRFKIGLCVEMGDVEEGKRVIADWEEKYPEHEGAITKSVELTILYTITLFYITIGEPSCGLDWVNRILNEPRSELRVDLQAMARILNLVIHYELGNWEFLEYGIKSTTRFLTNRERLFLYERTILKYLRQLSLLEPDRTKAQILDEFKAEITTVVQDKFEAQGLSMFDVLTWIEAHREMTPICQLVKKDNSPVQN